MRERFQREAARAYYAELTAQVLGYSGVSFDAGFKSGWQAAQIPDEKIEEMARRVQDKIQQVTMPTTKEIAEVLRQAMEGK